MINTMKSMLRKKIENERINERNESNKLELCLYTTLLYFQF